MSSASVQDAEGGGGMSHQVMTLVIDGRDVSAVAEQTILDVARESGISFRLCATSTVSGRWERAGFAWWRSRDRQSCSRPALRGSRKAWR